MGLYAHLIRRLKDGDLSGFDEIYDLSKKAVYYTAYSVFLNRDTAEDVMQETYLSLLEKKHKIPDDCDIVAYLCTMARNASFDLYKKLKKHGELLEEHTPGELEGTLDSGLLEKIGTLLNEKEYMVFLLRALGDFSFKEIAKMKGIPTGTATWLYQEARKKLQSELGEQK